MEKPHDVDDLLVKAGEYAKTTYDLSKLQLIDKSGDVLSSAAAALVAFAIGLVGILILSIGLSLVIGEALGHVYYGFFIVGGSFVLIGFFFYFFLHNRVKSLVNKSLKNELFN